MTSYKRDVNNMTCEFRHFSLYIMNFMPPNELKIGFYQSNFLSESSEV